MVGERRAEQPIGVALSFCGVHGIAPERLQQALNLPPHDARIGRRDGDAGVAVAGRVLRRAAAEDNFRGERRGHSPSLPCLRRGLRPRRVDF